MFPLIRIVPAAPCASSLYRLAPSLRTLRRLKLRCGWIDAHFPHSDFRTVLIFQPMC
jgi:hypothetical protein